MKKLYVYLFLVFFTLQTPSQADDIRDFQIEGISIGDSLLDYFSEEEIKKSIRLDAYEGSDRKFIDANFKYFSFYKIYDSLQIVFKPDDNNYIIYSISGGIFYDQDIKACFKKQKELDTELSDLFKNTRRVINKKQKHTYDPSGKSMWNAISYYFNSGGKAEIACYDWFEDMKTDDYLSVAIDTEEFDKWLLAYYEN